MPVHLAFISGNLRRRGAVTAFFLAIIAPGSANTRNVLGQIMAARKVRAAGMLRRKHAARPALTKP
jgi:hypothetical protein